MNPNEQVLHPTQIVQQFVTNNNLLKTVAALIMAKHRYVVNFKKEINEATNIDERLDGKRQLVLNLIEFNQFINFIDVLKRYPKDVLYFTKQFSHLNFIEMYDVVSDASCSYSNASLNAAIDLIADLKHALSHKHLKVKIIRNESLTLNA